MTGIDTVSDADGSATNDEFDAAFEEALSAKEQAPAEPAAASDGSDAAAPEAREDDAPLDDVSSDGSTGQAAAPDASAGKPSDDDIWEKADPALKAARDDLVNSMTKRERDLNNRLSAQGRELAQLRQLVGQRQTGSDPKGEGEKPQSLDDREDLKKLREEYGEVAGPLLDVISDLKGQLDGLKQPIEQMSEGQRIAYFQDNLAKVQTAIPDLAELVSRDDYGSWIESQPRAVQEAYARNQDQVVDPEEAIWVINMFKQHVGAGQAPASAQDAKPQSPSTTDQRRARQLDAQRDGGGGGGAPAAHGVPKDDFDAAADAYIGQSERLRSRR